MKKVFLSLAVLFSVALVSCGGNKANEENQDAAVEGAATEVVDVTVDTTPAGDTVATVTEEGAAAAAETPAPAEGEAPAENNAEAAQ